MPVSVPRVCGLSASFFHDERHWLSVFLYCARAASGTFEETQLSYSVRNLSHSSTPTLSAAAMVELVFLLVTTEPAGAGEFAFDGARAAFLFVSDLAHDSTKRPVRIHSIKRRDFDISVLRGSGWHSAQIIHLRPSDL